MTTAIDKLKTAMAAEQARYDQMTPEEQAQYARERAQLQERMQSAVPPGNGTENQVPVIER